MTYRPLPLALVVVALVSTPAVRANAPPCRYTILSGTVLDTKTTLLWQQGFGPPTEGGAPAKAYCAALELAGGHWRLPTVKELSTIIDFTTPSLLIDTAAFPLTPPEPFWSSTPAWSSFSYIPSAWFVSFGVGDGSVSRVDVSFTGRVRCVR